MNFWKFTGRSARNATAQFFKPLGWINSQVTEFKRQLGPITKQDWVTDTQLHNIITVGLLNTKRVPARQVLAMAQELQQRRSAEIIDRLILETPKPKPRRKKKGQPDVA